MCAELIEAITERDAPRSRNTLDEVDEDEAAVRVAARLEEQKFHFEVLDADWERESQTRLLVAIGPQMSSLLRACVKESAMKAVGKGEMKGGKVHLNEILGTTCVVAEIEVDFLEEFEIWPIVHGVLDQIPALKEMTIFDTISSANFMLGNGERASLPLTRFVGIAVEGMEPLESTNVVTGIAAGLLGEGDMRNMKASLLLSLKEGLIDSVTVQALIPFVLKSLGDLEDILNSKEDIEKKTSKIQEFRGFDKEQLYM